MVRDVLIVLIGIVLPIILLLFLAWHYLLLCLSSSLRLCGHFRVLPILRPLAS